MQRLLAIYRLVNILSIDVSLGAISGALLFASLCQVSVNLAALIALSFTVWIIYTTDHLLDVRHLKAKAAADRHRFHQRYFKLLAYCVLLFTLADLMMIFFMPLKTIWYGAALAFVVSVYILLRNKLSAAKEFCVAALYVAGIIIPVISIADFSFNEWLTALSYFLIAFINLALFSYMETESDFKDHHNSVSTKLGKQNTARVLALSFIFAVIAECFLYQKTGDLLLLSIMAFMTLILFIIFAYQNSFRLNNWYRIAGDAVFLLPLFYQFKK
jgi:L-asparagine transporter-like permease